MDWHLVEINIARLRAPLDDPQLADFTNNLDIAVAHREAAFLLGPSEPPPATTGQRFQS